MSTQDAWMVPSRNNTDNTDNRSSAMDNANYNRATNSN